MYDGMAQYTPQFYRHSCLLRDIAETQCKARLFHEALSTVGRSEDPVARALLFEGP